MASKPLYDLSHQDLLTSKPKKASPKTLECRHGTSWSVNRSSVEVGPRTKWWANAATRKVNWTGLSITVCAWISCSQVPGWTGCSDFNRTCSTSRIRGRCFAEWHQKKLMACGPKIRIINMSCFVQNGKTGQLLQIGRFVTGKTNENESNPSPCLDILMRTPWDSTSRRFSESRATGKTKKRKMDAQPKHSLAIGLCSVVLFINDMGDRGLSENVLCKLPPIPTHSLHFSDLDDCFAPSFWGKTLGWLTGISWYACWLWRMKWDCAAKIILLFHQPTNRKRTSYAGLFCGKQSTAEIELVDVINKFDSDWPELSFRWQNVKLLKTSPVPLVGTVHP